jgi:hypothetical protein
MMQIKFKLLRTLTVAFIFGSAIFGHSAKAQSMPGLAENQLLLPAKTLSIPFYWQGDTVNSKWEPYTAILIPVKLKNCPKQFFMQFDLGHPYSLFYKNKLLAIQSKYPKAIQVNQSTEKLLNFSFETGEIPVLAKEIVVKQFDSSTVNWINKTSVEIIGTIGTDFIDGKTVIIDYPQKKLTISQSIPVQLMSHLALTDFIYIQRSIMLPTKVKGKQTVLFFDTGSSMYELLTDKNTAQSLAISNTEVIRSNVKSWDKYLTANSLATNDSIEIGGTTIPIHYATYMEGYSSSQLERMMKLGIGGMTGNKIFLDYKLILDTKHKKVGLIRSK